MSLSAIALINYHFLFVCDEAFLLKPYKKVCSSPSLRNCSVFSLTVCSLLLRFQYNKGHKRNVFRRIWKNVM